MSGQAAEDAQSAEEILRQGERLLAAQFDASKALDAKAVSVLQASLSLGGASLGAATLAFAPASPWLPVWAAYGLVAGGVVFLTAAYLSAYALRTVQLEAIAMRPRTLLDIQAELLPVGRLRLALAFEFDKRIDGNERKGRAQARRVDRAMTTALIAPVAGVILAGLAALPDPATAVAAAAVAAAIIVLSILARRSAGLSS